ncbi:MAG: FecR domain-containing protein [Prolixibacteraceae bacterium]
MDIKKIKTIQDFSAGPVSDRDLNELFHWLNSEKGDGEVHQALNGYWRSLEDDERVVPDTVKMLAAIRGRMDAAETTAKPFTLKSLLPYAAILILALTLAGVLMRDAVRLPAVSKTALLATVVTENGQRSKIILPDSSVVWLNSGTTLSYNPDFASENRDIYLTGQAFFDVRRNEKLPLLVHCSDLVVKVLGTRFDVSAYPGDGKINVVLEEGSVQLLPERLEDRSYMLKPGEMGELDLAARTIVTGRVDVETYTAWKSGLLVFKNDPMSEVIEKLERWYNVRINVADAAVYNSIFTATIRNESLGQIIKLIEYSCPVSFQVKQDTGSVPQITIKSKR